MRRSLVLLMFTTLTAHAGSSIQLRVSATVPPPACEYPRACATVSSDINTRVTVSGETILYLGPTPSVRIDGNLLTISF